MSDQSRVVSMDNAELTRRVLALEKLVGKKQAEQLTDLKRDMDSGPLAR